MSQLELAEKARLTQAVVARVERSPHLARVGQLARLLETAGLHLIVVDSEGREFAPEGDADANRRDRGHRRYPAHLDVRPGTEHWWGREWPMFWGKTPKYTFDRARWRRDIEREWAKAERGRAAAIKEAASDPTGEESQTPRADRSR